MLRTLALSLVSGCAVIPSTVDYSELPIDKAIARTLDHLDEGYSFTEHKALDWQAERERLNPEAEEAASNEDIDRVIRQLVTTMPDSHVQLWNDDTKRDLCPEAEASYGIALSDLDDGRVIVTAASGELEPGDEVLYWNGLSVDDAAGAVAFHCFPVGVATDDRIRQVQLQLLTRDLADATSQIRVSRDGEELEVALTATPDTDDVLVAMGLERPDTLITREMLRKNVGYIRVGWEETYITEQRFQKALVALDREGAVGLVIDLRGNDGGMERTAANLAGYFTDRRWFYETVTFYNNRTGEQSEISEVWVEPQEVRWRKPVAVLVDANTVSSGEGLSMMFDRFAHVQVVGFEGTSASFGSTGSKVRLARGWTLHFPGGRSLDAEGRIQLDSDHTMRGGVYPNVRVPWTADNRIAHANGEDVALDLAIDTVLEAL